MFSTWNNLMVLSKRIVTRIWKSTIKSSFLKLSIELKPFSVSPNCTQDFRFDFKNLIVMVTQNTKASYREESENHNDVPNETNIFNL